MTLQDQLRALVNQLAIAVAKLQAQLALKNMTPTSDKIYAAAKASLDQHLTLDPSVPAELGCAEAMSVVLQRAGYILPVAGIAGTGALYVWCLSHGFTLVSSALPGDVIFAVSGQSTNGSPHGHVGTVLDSGAIASNDSNTGLFKQNYTTISWNKYFVQIEGFPMRILRAGA